MSSRPKWRNLIQTKAAPSLVRELLLFRINWNHLSTIKVNVCVELPDQEARVKLLYMVKVYVPLAKFAVFIEKEPLFMVTEFVMETRTVLV